MRLAQGEAPVFAGAGWMVEGRDQSRRTANLMVASAWWVAAPASWQTEQHSVLPWEQPPITLSSAIVSANRRAASSSVLRLSRVLALAGRPRDNLTSLAEAPSTSLLIASEQMA